MSNNLDTTQTSTNVNLTDIFSYEYFEKFFAPYSSNAELPPAVKNNLPEHAQSIWRAAFNSALEQYGSEERAAKVAWAAVKAKYHKQGDKWVKSETEGDNTADEKVEAKTPSEIVHKTPPKGYPESKGQYADPKRYKYPLDTEKHVRAALAYWSKPANRKGYSPEEQRTIWSRILRACKRLGIEVSKEEKSSIEEIMASSPENLPAEWVVAGKIYKDGTKRLVEAVPFNMGQNKNGWGLTEDAMRKMLKDSINKPVYWSHTDDPMCRDKPIGKIVDTVPIGTLDSKDDHIKIEIVDEEAVFKIDSGQWDHIGVSVGAKAPLDKILCSDCKTPFYECAEHPKAYKLVSDGFVDHWAVVKNPAFESAGFVDFLSSLNAALEAKGKDQDEIEFIEIDVNADLVIELEKANRMSELNNATMDSLKENPEVKKLLSERDSFKAEVERLGKIVSGYEKAEKDAIIAEIKKLEPQTKDEELSAMTKEILTKILDVARKVAAKATETVKSEANSSNPVKLDVTEKKTPSKEEVMKTYAKERMGIDVEKFLAGVGK